MKNSNGANTRILTVITVAALVFVLNISGALAGFWRTLDGMTANGVPSPAEYLFGQGTNGYANGLFGYGYGYGYGDAGFGDDSGFDDGSVYTGGASSSGGSNSSTSSSSSGSGGSNSSTSSSSSSSGGSSSSSSSSSSGNGDTDNGGTGVDNGTDTGVDEDDTSVIVPFSDTEGTWAEAYVAALYDLGIIDGYADGTFKPENPITRAEFLKIALKSFGEAYDEEDAQYETFSDVEAGTWVSNAVGRAQFLGLVSSENDMFNPNAFITRAEAMKILINASGLAIDEDVTASSFGDVSGWAAKYVQAALNAGIISENPTFRPNDNITRAETAKIAVLSINLMAE